MRALEYKFSLPNYVAVRAADRLPLPMIERGSIPGLREIAPDQKPLPGPDWLRIAPILTGICGSDISTILNRDQCGSDAVYLIPAHAGSRDRRARDRGRCPGSGFSADQRVVVMPLISCQIRGVEPCEPCARGEPGVCTKTTEGESLGRHADRVLP